MEEPRAKVHVSERGLRTLHLWVFLVKSVRSLETEMNAEETHVLTVKIVNISSIKGWKLFIYTNNGKLSDWIYLVKETESIEW